jgi:dihydrodipicolinate synthase/N-acetylneuraminate lyase
VTPLRDDGEALDEAAFAPYVDFLARGGLDGLLVLGTTGEGILLRVEERMRAVELFLEGTLSAIAHCGAQTTADTITLARHAAERGAVGVAVVAPPYFAFDEAELLAHFDAAARACAPTPFYVYEFAARSGYAVPVPVIERLRERAPNLAGLKVSDAPFERFSAYLLDGLDVFVGPEALIPEGLARGAVGAVSGLAAAFPDLVAGLVREPSSEGAEPVARLRAGLQRLPFHAAIKAAIRAQGVPLLEDVRRPLRGLDVHERKELERWLESS